MTLKITPAISIYFQPNARKRNVCPLIRSRTSHLAGEEWLLSAPSRRSNSSVAQSRPTLWDPVDWSTPGFPVHHQLLELAQTHVHWVSDAIQPSNSPLFSFPPAFNLSQNQGLFQWVSSSHQVAKLLELQLQHQSFQWLFRTDFL